MIAGICLYSGADAATAAGIFTKMDAVLQQDDISWENCVGVSVDNTSVNLGKRNSIFTRVVEKTLQLSLWAVLAISFTTPA